MDDLDKFIKDHKKELLEYAKKSFTYDKDGYPVLAKDDEWRDEKEDALWENHYKKLMESEQKG